MNENEYLVEYRKSESAEEYVDGTLEIDLDAYHESYATEEFHLSTYPKAPILRELHPFKMGFVEAAFHEQFGNDAVLDKDSCKELVEQIDQDVDELNEERSGWEEGEDE